MLDLDAIKARANAATPGPWTFDRENDSIIGADGYGVFWEASGHLGDLPFVAAVREDVPALVAEVERLRAMEARVRAIHAPYGIYDECDHKHEVGDPGTICADEIGVTCAKLYDVCRSCCAPGDGQTEECNDNHDHGEGKPICATIAMLDQQAGSER